jgi:D-alanyl-D-alanine carboxypeptidase
VLDEFEPHEVIIVGQEIRNMPTGYATNVHFEGETITVEVLLKSMLIRSSNETGRIFALNIIRRRDGRGTTMEQANPAFAALLNEKAASLGARGTAFTNSFGHHGENHFTTAYDLALITQAFMENPILAEIAGTRIFEGDSLNGTEHPEPNVREYSWTNTNQMLPHNPHGYTYMTGAKAGFTTAAGHVLAGAAEHNGLRLVTVVLGGTDASRWQDTRRLMDYGLENFAFRKLARVGEILCELPIENPRLGDEETLVLLLSEINGEETFTALLSHAEHAALTKTITFDPLIYIETENGNTILRAPIEEGMTVGTVTYSANGNILFEANAIASRDVHERTFDSDMDYHLAAFFANVFTRRALPYYFGIFGTAFGIFGIIIAVKASRRAGRNAGWTYASGHKSKYNRY